MFSTKKSYLPTYVFIKNTDPVKAFTYDFSFDQDSSSEELYEGAVKTVVNIAMGVRGVENLLLFLLSIFLALSSSSLSSHSRNNR